MAFFCPSGGILLDIRHHISHSTSFLLDDSYFVFQAESSGILGIAFTIPQVPSWMTVYCLSGGISWEIGHCACHSKRSLVDEEVIQNAIIQGSVCYLDDHCRYQKVPGSSPGRRLLSVFMGFSSNCLSGGIFEEIGHHISHSISSLLDDGYFGFQEESRGNRKR